MTENSLESININLMQLIKGNIIILQSNRVKFLAHISKQTNIQYQLLYETLTVTT